MPKKIPSNKPAPKRAKKRMNGEGSIIARKDKFGNITGYQAALSIGRDANGKLQRRVTSGKTKEEVKNGLHKLIMERHSGMLMPTAQLTVSAFCDKWLSNKEQAGEVKPLTLRSYRDTVRLYLTHTLGSKKLEALTALHVQGMLDQLAAEGKSVMTRRYSLSVLKMALNQAVAWNMVPRNVAHGIKPPKAVRLEMRVLSPTEAATFLAAAQSHRLYPAFLLAVMTGMRRGEILGLQWDAVSFEQGTLSVKRNLVDHRGKAVLNTPKTAKSQRRIYLPPAVLTALHDHQQRQEQDAARAGEAWQGQPFVFTSEVGTHTDPRNFERMYANVLKKSGVSKVRFHDLRHTAASLMIRKGISPKIVADTLGHTNVSFTLDRYTHLYDDQRKDAVLSMDDLTDGAPGGK